MELVRKLKESKITQSRINRAGKLLARKRLIAVHKSKDFIWGEVKRWKKGDTGFLPYTPSFRSDGAFSCTCRAFTVNSELFCSHLTALLMECQDSPQLELFLQACVERESNDFD